MKLKAATKFLFCFGVIANLLTTSYGVHDLTLSPLARTLFVLGGVLSVVPPRMNTFNELIKFADDNAGNKQLAEEINGQLRLLGVDTSNFPIEKLVQAFATTPEGSYFKYNDRSAQLARTEICLEYESRAVVLVEYGSRAPVRRPFHLTNLFSIVDSSEYKLWFYDIANAVLATPFDKWTDSYGGKGGWRTWQVLVNSERLTRFSQISLLEHDIRCGCGRALS